MLIRDIAAAYGCEIALKLGSLSNKEGEQIADVTFSLVAFQNMQQERISVGSISEQTFLITSQ